MLKLKPNHYHNYRELTDFLKQAKKNYPDLFDFKSMGKTPSGKNIWLVTLTQNKVARDTDKPAFWIDANTHASEITGAESCLYFIFKCLTQYKKDPEITYLLDHVTFYIAPRLSVDGAENYIHKNEFVRSSPVLWPHIPSHENFVPQDLNRDGWILTMRKESPAGAFKTSSKNPKVMIPRSHTDIEIKGAKYYQLFPEGLFRNFDGFNENYEDDKSFDLNRQYPANFRPEGLQYGAGPYPLYLNEARALVKNFTERHRIFGHVTLHTYGGLVLRPPSNHHDEKFNSHDIEVFEQLLQESAKVSGYKALSTFKDFRYDPRDTITGTTDDWSFEHRGVYSFTVEIWDVWKQAGLDVKSDVNRYFNPTEEELVTIFSWAKQNLKFSDFFMDWTPFEHPQLGMVEIGGWKLNYLFSNPPPKLLKGECEKVFKIICSQAKALPQVKFKSIELRKISETLTQLNVILENSGYLPTNGSKQAVKVGAVNKPSVQLKLSKNIRIHTGKMNIHPAHLCGRNRFLPWHSPVIFNTRKNTHQAQFQWILEGSGSIEIHCDFARGGVLREKLKVN